MCTMYCYRLDKTESLYELIQLVSQLTSYCLSSVKYDVRRLVIWGHISEPTNDVKRSFQCGNYDHRCKIVDLKKKTLKPRFYEKIKKTVKNFEQNSC